jgi:N-acetyl-anhydromuramyl-L-alanine amidase AmpD
MVEEKYIAGDYPTKLKGVDWKSVNVCSIGIELSGPPTSINKIIKKNNWNLQLWTGWPEKEIQALINLCINIEERWPGIRLTDHSTIAPGRKSDVKKKGGIDRFPWDRLLSETGIEEA